ncbi:MAG: hypothetical protein JNL23_12945 [Chitinophagaceae bacterium]|nr:hypothetical protein [Chitinophagaceae bacterium]
MTDEDVMDLSETDDHNEGNCFINSSSEMSICFDVYKDRKISDSLVY